MNPALGDLAPAADCSKNKLTLLMISAVYRVAATAREVDTIARDIALEQTVEVPEALITSDSIREQVVGRVLHIEPTEAPDQFDVTVGYPADVSGYQLPQLLNLIYGNISLKRQIQLIDLTLPAEVLAAFPGPNFGIAGLRRLLGVYNRPLLATALKPCGSSSEELARMAGEFAAGGGDVVKDDHNLHDPSFEEFRERIARCQEAVAQANLRTGRNTLYMPNIMAPLEQLDRQLECVVSLGIRGVLVSPFILGIDVVRSISARYGLAILAHPTVSGAFFHDPTHGVPPGLLLGRLFRLMGADASIFPNFGGRFTFSDADCRDISEKLREPLGHLAPAFPAPAGGMRFDNIPQMAEQYGEDSIFLIGGALLSHSESLAASTRAFRNRIESLFSDHREVEPESDALLSACELPSATRRAPGAGGFQHLPFQADYRWEGRSPTVYKASSELAFQGVARHEIVGTTGEQTAFDLRYFEIAPGGYSSLEKHAHTHTVIGVRGIGTLIAGEERIRVAQHDVAYVPPMLVHQLRNEGTEPFGFFCIVDHTRDRPMAP